MIEGRIEATLELIGVGYERATAREGPRNTVAIPGPSPLIERRGKTGGFSRYESDIPHGVRL